MPQIKSAKKRVKVAAKKAAANKAENTALKTAIKKANVAIETNADNKEAVVKDAVKRMTRLLPKTSCTRIPLQERRAVSLQSLTKHKKQSKSSRSVERELFFCLFISACTAGLFLLSERKSINRVYNTGKQHNKHGIQLCFAKQQQANRKSSHKHPFGGGKRKSAAPKSGNRN